MHFRSLHHCSFATLKIVSTDVRRRSGRADTPTRAPNAGVQGYGVVLTKTCDPAFIAAVQQVFDPDISHMVSQVYESIMDYQVKVTTHQERKLIVVYYSVILRNL